MKIIFLESISAHQYKADLECYRPGTKGFIIYGMGKFIARELLKQSKDYSCEVWRQDKRIKKTEIHYDEGIKYIIFPSILVPVLGEFSLQLMKQLIRTKKNRDIAFHVMGTWKYSLGIMTKLVAKHNIAVTHIGGADPLWKYNNNGNKLGLILHYLCKSFFLTHYTKCITICKPVESYFRHANLPVVHSPILGMYAKGMEIKDKVESKKKLGLPLEKKVILQVGRAYKKRGFDWIIDFLDASSDEYFFVFVGINISDPYYDELIIRGEKVIEYVGHEELSNFYNAADVLIYLPHDKEDLSFAGTSYVPLEALACGTQVLATTLHHLPKQTTKLFYAIPEKFDDLKPMLSELLSSNIDREKCREFILSAFSWEKVINTHLEVYNGEFNA